MSDKLSVHLSNVAACLSSVCDLSHLQSHLLWVCSKISGGQTAKSSLMCPKCCHVWHAGKFSMKLRSSISPGPRMRKILHKMEKTPEKLNRIELSLMKKHQQSNRNKLVLHCNTCKHETTMQSSKKSIEVPCPVQDEVSEVTLSTKKKKKKDRFAGLNASAVLSATPSPSSISLRTPSLFKSMSDTVSTPSTANIKVSQTFSLRRSLNDTVTVTPKASRLQQQPGSCPSKKGPKSMKQKMNLLREETKQAEQNRAKEEYKALSMRNVNIRKNNKLQDFLSKKEKDVHLEDRINSLLQL